MKSLVVYYSFTGNNELLAKEIQRQLDADVLKLTEIKKRNGFSIMLDLLFKRKPKLQPYEISLKDYDQVVLLAPIWAGKVASPLVSFLEKEKENIRRYSFVTICGGSEGQKEKISEQLTEILEQRPFAVLELWVNDLLIPEQKDTIKYTSGYRITQKDVDFFKLSLAAFTRQHRALAEV